MPHLPKLIFTETHEDSISGEILKEILPELVRLGYEVFYAEVSGVPFKKVRNFPQHPYSPLPV